MLKLAVGMVAFLALGALASAATPSAPVARAARRAVVQHAKDYLVGQGVVLSRPSYRAPRGRMVDNGNSTTTVHAQIFGLGPQGQRVPFATGVLTYDALPPRGGGSQVTGAWYPVGVRPSMPE